MHRTNQDQRTQTATTSGFPSRQGRDLLTRSTREALKIDGNQMNFISHAGRTAETQTAWPPCKPGSKMRWNRTTKSWGEDTARKAYTWMEPWAKEKRARSARKIKNMVCRRVIMSDRWNDSSLPWWTTRKRYSRPLRNWESRRAFRSRRSWVMKLARRRSSRRVRNRLWSWIKTRFWFWTRTSLGKGRTFLTSRRCSWLSRRQSCCQ